MGHHHIATQSTSHRHHPTSACLVTHHCSTAHVTLCTNKLHCARLENTVCLPITLYRLATPALH
ncbi:uncharacterized protein G2W53_009631 [Senna tora]|uniref:Uncharacterized protein n=1 Tax=Senna tora TaxID=362788 RepID=A0A834WYC1_9FABA|nr:uncharacterized protein G2W53_009631 [Senna tora]